MSYWEDMLRKFIENQSSSSTKKKSAQKKTVTKKRKDEEDLMEEFVRTTYDRFKTVAEANAKNGKSTIFTDDEDIAPTRVGGGGRLFDTERESSSGTKHGGGSVSFASEDVLARQKEKEKEAGWFKGSGAFEDGYQFGDVLKTVGGAANDATNNIIAGILGIGEKTVDAGAYVLGKGAEVFGQDGFRDKIQEFIAKDLINEDKLARSAKGGLFTALGTSGVDVEGILDDWSILGEKSDSLAQSGGQLLGQIGLQYVGVPWWVTSGVTSFGAETENALKQGASYDDAGLSAVINAGAEILTEKLFGGSGLNEKGLINLDGLTKGISSKAVKTLLDFGIDLGAEGSEEVVAGFISNLSSKLYKEENLGDLLFSEEALQGYLDDFLGGMILSGTMNAGKAVTSARKGRDYRSGLNADEEAVFNNELEKRIAEKAKASKDGEVSKRDKAKLYDEVMEDLESGSIDVDDIERILGGDSYTEFDNAVKGFKDSDTYKAYLDAVAEEKGWQTEYDELSKVKTTDADLGQNARFNELKQKLEELKTKSKSGELKTQLQPEIDRINELKAKMRGETIDRLKDSKLSESYRELMRSTEKFTADVSSYKNENAKKTVQNIIDSGLTDNSNKMHRFVDFMAKIAEARGVTFSLTDAKKLAGTVHDLKGATANAFVEGNEITINIDSKKRLNSLVGHEITHVLEGTEFYDTLSKAVQRYAMSKGEWDSRLADITELYKKHRPDADPTKELVADLVGDYVFTDKSFVESLSQHRNVFQKVYDEIKWLCKIVTAGSEEARNLVEAKRIFEMVWRKSPANGNSEAKNSISADGRQLTAEQDEFFKDSVVRDENGNLKPMYHGTSNGGHTVFDTYGSNYGLFGQGSYFTDSKTIAESYTTKGKGTNPQVYETYLNIKNPIDMDAEANPAEWRKAFPDASFPQSGTNEDFYRAMEEYFEDNEYPKWEAADAAMDAMERMGYDGITHIGGGRVNADGERHRVYIAFNPEQIKNIDNVNPTSDPDIRYSITKDSEGSALTDAQQEFFKDTKAVDRNGNLLKVYHTTKNDFTVFDDARKGEATGGHNTYMGHFFTDDPDYMSEFPEFKDGKTDAYYLNMKNPIDMNNISRQAFLDIVEVTGGDVAEAAEIYDQEYEAELQRAKNRGDNSTIMEMSRLLEELTGNFYDDAEFHEVLRPNFDKLLAKGYDGFINNMDGMGWANEYIVIDSNQAKLVTNTNPTADSDIRYSLSDTEVQETNDVLKDIGVELDGKSGTVSYSISSLEDAFGIKKDGLLDDYTTGEDYLKAREEYVEALRKATGKTKEECDRYLDSLFLVGEMIANDKARLDYEAAVNKSAWVSNAEYGGSIDFSTLCAKRRLFTGTFDAIQEALPDTVLNENDFLRIRNMLLAKELESPCSMCYVEGSRAKHGEYVAKFLNEYLATNPAWRPQIADFTSSTRLEQTRINHPEAYEAYTKAMNKLAQRKPKEASVRTDYKGEILVAFEDGSSVAVKNKNGGVRFNSFSDFEIIHALDCMQVITDMARVGLNGQAYTKVAAFAEAFGNTGLKINLSLVAKDVDENGKLIYDEVNGMKSAEAFDIRNRYSENVGTVIVVFNEAQLKAALADSTIDYVLPFHRSQWKKSQYTMMGLPVNTRDFTMLQNDRIRNPKTGKPVKLSKIKHTSTYTNDLTGETFEIKDNIMPNQYWDFSKSGRENAQRYLDYINANNMIPKFNFLLEKVDGKWTLPADAVGDGYYKLLIDFKMYNNDGVGSPQNPVLPEFNMPYIQKLLKDYKGGHQAFPVAHDVVDEFVKGKQSGKHSLSEDGSAETDVGGYAVYGSDVKLRSPEEFGFNPLEDIAPVAQGTVQNGQQEPVDEFAPVVNQPVAQQPTQPVVNDAPVREEYEPIRPQKQPRMVRTDAPVRDDFAPHTAEVLTEETVKPKEEFNILHKLEEVLVDKGAVIERLSKKTKNRELDAKYNYLHYSNSNAQKFIGEGDPDKGIRSLKDIAKQVEESGKEQEFFDYLYNIHNIDRMTLSQRGFGEDKAVYGNHVTADMSRAEAQRIEAENPEFRQLAVEIYAINNHLRQMMVEGGLISQETADLWQKMYPHYVPIRRADFEGMAVNVPLDTNRTGVNHPVKRAKGGNGDISPLFGTIADRILQTYRAVDRNSFGLELKKTLGSASQSTAADFNSIMDGVDAHEELLQKGNNGKAPTFTVFENGKRTTFEITEEMYDAMKPTSKAMAYTNKVANTISNVRRGLITEYNPVFMATNAIKDAQDVLMNSQHAWKTYKNFPRAWKEMLTNGKYYKEYMKHGGEQNTYFERDGKTFKKEKSTLRKIVGFPLDLIAKANNVIERVPRLAEYIASREDGRSIQTSMLDAARVTTNFAAGGDFTKALNRNGFTFLNASVQGARQAVRNVQEAKMEGFKGWAKLAGKTVLAGLPALLLNGLLWDDDEEYEELPDYVKEGYYIVGKFGDGQFVRIPKGRAVAVIQEAFRQMEGVMTGDDNIDLGKFTQLVLNNLAPNSPLDNFIFAPMIQAGTNTAWHGGDIVPQSMENIPAAEQYDESTDILSRWLGEKLNNPSVQKWLDKNLGIKWEVSPMKVNYLLDQYSGALGDVFLPMMTPEAERGGDSFGDYMAAPWVDKFTTDSVMNNRNVSDFYDLKEKLTISANASGASDEDVLMSKYVNSVSSDMGELYSFKRNVQSGNLTEDEKEYLIWDVYNSSLSDDEKDALIEEIESGKLSNNTKYTIARGIQNYLNSEMENAMSTHEDISYKRDVKTGDKYAVIGGKYFKQDEDGEWSKLSDEAAEKYKITSAAGDANYATDGNVHYRWYVPDEDSKTEARWEKLTDKEVAKQNKVTSKLGITPEEYWGNKAEYDFAYENPNKYAFSKAVGGYESYRNYSSELYDIKADKDANGKSISGSRKAKVIDYINNLDADYGEKIILYKSEYPSDDSYNHEIIDYLNNRSDISYDEMVAILEELDMKVHPDGTVTWD